MRSHYETLGISRTATLAEIRKAYGQAALRNHPDHGGDHVRMVQINEAYAILCNPALRAEHDRLISQEPNRDAEARWEARTESVRTAAQNYPRKWADFELWASHLTGDIANAKYSVQPLWYGISIPRIEGSRSAILFYLVGIGLGIGLIGFASGVYPAAIRVFLTQNPQSSGWDMAWKSPSTHLKAFLLLSPILLGLWAGYYAHKMAHELIKESSARPPEPAAGDATPPDTPHTDHNIINCTTCGQKLRVPKLQSELLVICPKCRNKFTHGSTNINSQVREHPEGSRSVPQDDPASESPTAASSEPEVAAVSTPAQDAAVTALLASTAAAFLLVSVFGWALFFPLMLWIVVILCSSGAILFTLAALDSSSQDSERASFWWVAAICAVITVVAANWLPLNVSSTNAAQPVAGSWAN